MNPGRYDLLSIRLAVACERTGSLTAAARESHLALAAASRRLRELEEAVGSPLFDRHARGLTPTTAGRLLVRHGLALLQTLEQLDGELADLRLGLSRHIRLCASTAAINQFLPPLLAAYARQQPQVRVDLEEQVSEAVVASLREGRADAGVFVEGPDVTDLATRVFRHDELVLVLPPRHALAAHPAPLPFADALDEDWISLNTGAAMLQKQQQAALAAGRPLRLRMQVRSFDAVCHLVASGLGIAVLPKVAALPIARVMGLRTRALADAWARRRLLVATMRTVVERDAGVAQLVNFLVEPSPAAKAGRRKQ
jgi:DNA-binding transcriptional LysR family regulator